MSLADDILAAGSAGDWGELNRAGRALAAAYELARMVDIDADRDRAQTAPIHRDDRVPHLDGDRGTWEQP